MKLWWRNHQNELPIFEDGDKARVEDLTGCIPLLLRPLFEWANRPFRDIEQNFLAHSDLDFVRENVRDFAAGKMKDQTHTNYQE